MNQYYLDRATRVTEMLLALFGILVYVYGILLIMFYRTEEITLDDPSDGLTIWTCRMLESDSMTNPLFELSPIEKTTGMPDK